MRRHIAMAILAGGLLVGQAVAAVDPFAVDGKRITVTTERYRVVVDGLAITEISNRITGEIYAQSGDDGSAPTTALEQFNGRAGVQVARLAGNAKDFTREFVRPDERTKVEVQRLTNGVRVVYTGLYSATAAEPQMVLTLDCTVDPANGDLCLAPVVQGNIPVIAGCQDRGVQVSAIQVRHLADELDLILPIDNGAHFTRSNGGATLATNAVYRAGWPQSWQAAIFIAEGAKGCMALWADEAEMRYQRFLSLARSGSRWYAGFEYGPTDLIWRCRDIGGVWRFNVFDGYWVKAAARYRAQCERQWPDMRPVEQRTPEWARQVRIQVMAVMDLPQGEAIMKLLPPGSHVIDFTTQGWLKGWNNGDVRKIYGAMDGIFPNWPYENPVRYEGEEGFTKSFAGLEKMGVHVFPYLNTCFLLGNHPWVKEKLGYRHNFNWTAYGRFFAEFEDDVVKRYGVSGIYEDCSWVGTGSVGGDVFGTPDGMSGFRGTADMRKYFRTLQPNIATMGERRHEATARSQMFALQVTGWKAAQAHPVLAYLQEPYCRIYNFEASSASADVDDIQGGLLTRWTENVFLNPRPCQEDRMWMLRGQVFTREQLLNDWPETWDPAVLHYFKSRDGAAFRMVRDHGVRFVKKTAGGDETIYWRLTGTNSVAAKGAGIEGWVGSDGDRLIGLNPRATYCVFSDVDKPPAAICAVPEGYGIKRCVVREGFWIAELDTTARLARPLADNAAPIEPVKRFPVALRVRGSGTPLHFAGAEAVKELPNHEYEVTVPLPGGFAAYWDKPSPVLPNVSLGRCPALNTVHRRDTGLVVQYDAAIKGDTFNQQDGTPQNGEEGSIPWLIKVPVGVDWLQFKYGGEHAYGDGANYMVRINGNTIWKRYQPASIGFNKEKGEPIGAPAKWGAVDLRPYQDTTIVLELAVNGHHTGVSEVIRWHEPVLTAKEPPGSAETEKAAPPKSTDADFLPSL